jgi:hypothetical protein
MLPRRVVHKPRHQDARIAARRFEEALPAEARKRLGQFFTGVPLGKLLSHLALQSHTRTVLDPMAGHGDLIDAVSESAFERGIPIERSDGIEIDKAVATFCSDRLKAVGNKSFCDIICGNAFDRMVLKQLPHRSYDLTIANPPYVRYQSQHVNPSNTQTVRDGLKSIINWTIDGPDKPVWETLVHGYSGLADLSIPAWFLAALMVRPAGHLALVVPATWRSRDYGDVVRYLLLRCFDLECIVEDIQPGWFSDALVRTNLIVARRLSPQEIALPLSRRFTGGIARWVTIGPESADARSLVGSAFTESAPEAAFVKWLHGGAKEARLGIQARDFDIRDEWGSLQSRASHRAWFRILEPERENLPLFAQSSSKNRIPESVRDLVDEETAAALTSLDRAGILVGQGLRTGCNRFFYVDECGASPDDAIQVMASEVFRNRLFSVPSTVLRPVLRRQSELPSFERGEMPSGRVLDLRGWVLPEDAGAVQQAADTYVQLGQTPPKIMPDDLAQYVRLAASPSVAEEIGASIPLLSAVRTNARVHRNGRAIPRFWYMLPDFMSRHQPGAFVARVNHGAPRVECNFQKPILIDANFSTFWTAGDSWSHSGVKALLNSVWCQLLMEALGTPMGGGALKLEATNLRQLPVPILSRKAAHELGQIANRLVRADSESMDRIDEIILGALFGHRRNPAKEAKKMTDRIIFLRQSRRRKAA